MSWVVQCLILFLACVLKSGSGQQQLMSQPSTQLKLELIVDDMPRLFNFTCEQQPRQLASAICSEIGQPTATCSPQVSTRITQIQANDPICDNAYLLENLLEKPIKDFLRLLQFRILEKQTYLGVQTWKFPFDLWMYLEIISSVKPDVIVEIGNRFGGSALYIAHYLDRIGKGRIIGVDIDQSEISDLARNHPRIEFIEGDGVAMFPHVKRRIHKGEKVLVIEDASHLFQPTLELLRLYTTLVDVGSYMIIEDTVLHNGVENDAFQDPGAYASVVEFLKENHDFHSDRSMERFMLTWNPIGFLKRHSNHLKNSLPNPSMKLQNMWLSNHQLELQQTIATFVANAKKERLNLSSVVVNLSPNQNESTMKIQLEWKDIAEESATGLFHKTSTFCALYYQPDNDDNRTQKHFSITTNNEDREACGTLLAGKVLHIAASSWGLQTLIPSSNIEQPRDVLNFDLSTEGPKRQLVNALSGKFSPGIGAAVSVLPMEQVKRLRDGILRTWSEPYQEERHSTILCAMKSESGCIAEKQLIGEDLHMEMIKLAAEPSVIQIVESVLGTDCVLDNVKASTSHPGTKGFNPHIDRPFDSEWTYSQNIQEQQDDQVPPAEYPMSVQVVFLLDDFTEHNGALYYVPNSHRSDHSNFQNRKPLQGKEARELIQVVQAPAGTALFFNGNLFHGALANFTPRPRVALLFEYVRRIVRPGHRFPHSLLNHKALQASSEIDDLRRLYDLQVDQVVLWQKKPYETTLMLQHFACEKSLRSAIHDSVTTHGGALDDATLDNAMNQAIEIALFHGLISRPPPIVCHNFSTLSDVKHKSDADPVKEQLHSGAVAQSQDRLLSIPKLGYGTGIANSSNTAGEFVLHALEMGFRMFDCASAYNNLESIGEMFNKLWGSDSAGEEEPKPNLPTGVYVARKDVTVISKLWVTEMEPKRVREYVLSMLRKLQIDSLDILVIHWPFAAEESNNHGGLVLSSKISIFETYRAMESLVAEGLVLHLGVSNFPILLLRELVAQVQLKPVLNQIELHPRTSQPYLVEYCHSVGIQVMSYSPLAGGKLLSPNAEGLSQTEYSQLESIANSKGISVPDLLLLWNLHTADSAIVRTTSKAHMLENLRIMKGYLDATLTLSLPEIQLVGAMNQNQLLMAPPQFAAILA